MFNLFMVHNVTYGKTATESNTEWEDEPNDMQLSNQTKSRKTVAAPL